MIFESINRSSTNQVILLWYFEQQSFMVPVIGKKDIYVVLVAQIEAAVRRPRSVKDMQSPLFDLHAHGLQLVFMALPLVRYREQNRAREET